MSVINQLASSLGRNDEVPNQELAAKIAKKKDKEAVGELIHLLDDKNKGIQNDCIKVLYEIGAINPSLITRHAKVFFDLLHHRNNRLQWGAMTAIATIAPYDPKLVFGSLAKIIDAADKGSVITRDQAVMVLIALCSDERYADKAFDLLNEQLLKSPVNQLPMYAERAAPVVSDKNRALFIKSLSSRLDEIEQDSKRIRIEKVIKKVGIKK